MWSVPVLILSAFESGAGASAADVGIVGVTVAVVAGVVVAAGIGVLPAFTDFVVLVVDDAQRIAFNTGKEWKDLKKFTISTLRDLGMEANIFQAIMDLFTAGSDTASSVLIWVFIYMAKYPDIQDKCRAEIEKITDLNRPITMEDKQHMTYVAATLLEVQRIAPVVTLTLPHAATVDTTLGGYDIPKHTIVLFNIMDAHYDPNYWDKPEEFRPERWIDEDNELKKNEAFMPFSLGPRICAGISLANIETFMAFSNILQRFKLESPDETPMTMEGKQSGVIYVPVNDNIRAIPFGAGASAADVGIVGVTVAVVAGVVVAAGIGVHPAFTDFVVLVVDDAQSH
ncbi:cytochrome P450 2B4-like [Octopus vulgaris]|uniref:Cytochrome P450 2B4-like n=1 Tax=Octopus vulgaris TaxID=6645 RepID=A0AA36B8D8_OCTVU|nr:cytochrome P450 2B4-like [Octopus vulgaris]